MELGQVQNGVRVISVVALMGKLFGEDVFKSNGPTYKEISNKVNEWIADNDAHYYAAPKEDFSVSIGIREANDIGKQIVVVDNLS